MKHGSYEYVQQIYTPSGKLKFILTGGLYGVQREWSDRPDNPVESQVPAIMRGILTATDHLVAKRIEQVEQQRRNLVERRLRERQARVVQLTRARQQRVDRLVDDWQRSENITKCVHEIEATGKELPPKEMRLIRWARDLARHYDPLEAFNIAALDDDANRKN